MFRWNFLYFSLCCSVTGCPWEESGSISFNPASVPAISASLCTRCSSTLFIFIALSASVHPHLSCTREPRTGHRALDIPHQFWAERVTSLDLLGNALSITSQEPVGLLCCNGTLLAHGQLGVHQDTLVIPFWTAFSQSLFITSTWGYSLLGAGFGNSLSQPLWSYCQPSFPASQSPSNLSTTTQCNIHSSMHHLQTRVNPWGTPLLPGRQLDSVLQVTTL